MLNNTKLNYMCNECDEDLFPVTLQSPGGIYHSFVPPPRLAGGAYTQNEEREAYERALRGEL